VAILVVLVLFLLSLLVSDSTLSKQNVLHIRTIYSACPTSFTGRPGFSSQ
jgi:hypothetical protein